MEAAVIGAACRLPGADSVSALWGLLSSARNSVRARPEGRWSIERFLREGAPERGFSYSFAGGYLDDPLAFDPSLFGVSPREAQQMDPQQRLLLETSWRAFEDAGIPPASVAGQNVGVYVGASMVDYQNHASHDPAVMESHFMTGNSLAVLSNRISYLFDLRGPSFTTDSACSSSFVALTQALAALRDGQIDMALVAGVNLLLSPAPFIGFSQARMLSPTGLSRPFSQQADGYVRSEGSVVLLLRRLPEAVARGERIRSVVLGAATNSDGRTSGISLPSQQGQQSLIENLYAELELAPDALAFVEAHGTGTKVGDPIEASAIGQALGVHRSRKLPIGSIKSNIGHLEAASGLAGLLKASLALEHRMLPESLFTSELNEAIDFDALNLQPAQGAVRLEEGDALFAGVCNYGFGGANAHVVLRSAGRHENRSSVRPVPARRPQQDGSHKSGILLVSAATPDALAARCAQIADVIDGGEPSWTVASELAHRHEMLNCRVAIPLAAGADAADLLRKAKMNSESANSVGATTSPRHGKLAFVFSGNGNQFADMGRAAYHASRMFRREIDQLDAQFHELAGWSISEFLRNGVPAESLARTSVSQPLIYAVQSALVSTLACWGVRPQLVIGHSVGEVAAAEAGGCLTRADALRVIHLRSLHQEAARGCGRMLVVAADCATTLSHIEAVGAGALLGIAAVNSRGSTTVSGDAAAIARFARHCRQERIASRELDIDYPFHSSLLDGVEHDVIADLRGLAPVQGGAAFVSTVTGQVLDGAQLDAQYWWRNIREPVQFEAAIQAAADAGADVFVEIGPRAILTGAMRENLRARQDHGLVLPTLSANDSESADPVELALARLVAHGVSCDKRAVFGEPSPRRLALPGYPFQRQDFGFQGTSEAVNAYGRVWDARPRHPLLGARMAEGSPEWRNLLDVALVPYLADHKVDGSVIVPATGLIEIALSAGRDLFGDVTLELDEFDVLKALSLLDGETREISTRYSAPSGTVEIWSRKRFSDDSWTLHARGALTQAREPAPKVLAPPEPSGTRVYTAAEVYAEAVLAGLQYGPRFQLVGGSMGDHYTSVVDLASPGLGLGAYADVHALDPVSFDAAFHALFLMRPQREGETKAHLPIRFRKVCLWKPGTTIRRAIIHLTHESDRTKTVAISLLGEDGALVASVQAAVLRALYLSKATIADRTFRTRRVALTRERKPPASAEWRNPRGSEDSVAESWLLLRAFLVSLAHRSLKDLPGAPAPGAESLFLSCTALVESFSSGVGELNLPAPERILRTLVQRCPEAMTEIRFASRALGALGPALHKGDFQPMPARLARRFEADCAFRTPLLRRISAHVAALLGDAPLRVLMAGDWNDGLLRELAPHIATGALEVTLAASDQAEVEHYRRDHDGLLPVQFVVVDDSALNAPLRHDALIALAGPSADKAIARALPLLTAGASIVIGVAAHDRALDVLAALWPDWSLRPSTAATLRSLCENLRIGGATDIFSPMRDEDGAGLIFARASGGAPAAADHEIAIVDGRSAIRRYLACDAPGATWLSMNVSGAQAAEWLAQAAPERRRALVVPPLFSDLEQGEQVAQRVEWLTSLLTSLQASGASGRVVVVCEGACGEGGANAGPEAAVWGFVRVAMNEFPGVDLRLVDMGPGRPAAALSQIVNAPGAEREWLVDEAGLHVNRIIRGLFDDTPCGPDERTLLQFEQTGRIDSAVWRKAKRTAPQDDEIEIEVAAIGLNFRDVLVGQGILDDDLLGAGLTGAALGFECSGIVTRIGAGVNRLKPGDRVMGFAADAFASHIVAPSWHFFAAPEGVSLEAAATIPVAFATAWYALITRGQIRSGENVLVHGAAGAVGIAAVQIAALASGRVLGTASTDERRAIASASGADLVFDSRHERFVDPILRETGGVDVVLNSLAGSAMTASFKLVQPFGRFLELGKRDYLDNTLLALRPFVRNIAYFGIDLDELLAHDRDLVETLMTTIAGHFAKGDLHALPYQVFEGHEVAAAFRSMQASRHAGKAVVRPARYAQVDGAALSGKVAEGAYLVVGGTTGLGFATARWLAQKGATTLVLASRRGAVDPELEADVLAMRSAGKQIIVEALDVLDARAVQDLVVRIARDLGPLRGVVHAAVRLDDGLIASLTPDRLRNVLRTKIDGALNLEAATRGHPLDLFVLYSSATTIVGSPGQGAYVAANAWLEGFARRRRAAGRPALAIGWGAISDVGIIARDQQLGERLRRTTGVMGIRASEALAHLGRLLALGERIDPVQFYANVALTGAAEKLSLLQSPAYADLFAGRRSTETQETGDLMTLIAGKDAEQSLAIVTQAVRREVAMILRMSDEQVDPARPLSDLGLDSLMALELHMGIERLSGAQIPMIGSGDRRVSDIAAAVLKQISATGEPESPAGDGMHLKMMEIAAVHSSGLSPEGEIALREKMTFRVEVAE